MEKTISVSSARQNLMKLTKHVSDHMDQIVLTNKGKAETVLLSVAEYQSLRAAAELVMHPEVLAATNRGFRELESGQGVSLEDAFNKQAKKGKINLRVAALETTR